MLKTFILSLVFCFALSAEPVIEIQNAEIPILINKEKNAVTAIKVGGGQRLTSIEVEVDRNCIKDIESVSVYQQKGDKFRPQRGQRLYGETDSIEPVIKFSRGWNVNGDHEYFWLTVKVKESVSLRKKIGLRFKSVTFAGSDIKKKFTEPFVYQRTGVNVRDTNDDGVKGYRIPGVVTTKKGTILAVYDTRYNSARDLQGHMDIGLSRSTDGGQTWEPMQQIIDMGTWGGLPEKFNGVSDACILVDDKTNDIYVAGLWMHGIINSDGKWLEGLNEDSKEWTHQWYNKASYKGFGPKQTSQFMMVKSSDDGKTWSKPRNLTKMLKKEEWYLFAPGPGRGITMKDGTLVMPTQGRDHKGHPFSNIIYSKDGGKTWKTSKAANTNTTEAQVVQLEDGSLMLNMRDNRNYHYNKNFPESGRSVYVTKDLGETWKMHPTSRIALPEPVCCAGFLKHTFKKKIKGLPKSILIFSNPPNKNKKGGRNKMTIKISLDNGETWPEKYHTLIDTFGGAYSCLTSVNNSTIGILYEGSRARICFQQLSLKELLKVQDKKKK